MVCPPCFVWGVNFRGTGKTSLLNVFTRGFFPEAYEPTVFENCPPDRLSLLMVDVHDIYVDGHHIVLSLWDTAGPRCNPSRWAVQGWSLTVCRTGRIRQIENVVVCGYSCHHALFQRRIQRQS